MSREDKIKRTVNWGSASAVGIEIVAAIVIGALGGKWLDDKFGTAPYLTLFGIIAGIGAAVKAVIRVIKKFGQEEGSGDESSGSRNKKMDG
ncbi:MAG: hypothetical protein Kow0090_10260 [Myxococcota bacterium]